jgi:roadblock/LC7 domain-containing protein
MIKRLLIHDGVNAVCNFRDDGTLVEGYGLLDYDELVQVAQFAHAYRRVMQGHADMFAMFSAMKGWTPPRGWIVRGQDLSLCGTSNVACVVENQEIDFQALLQEMQEIANW